MKNRRLIFIGLLILILIVVGVIFVGQRSLQNTSPAPSGMPQAAASAAPVYSFDDPDWWDHAVFYEIFVRSFYDSNGDGIGDFNGITQKLDYLNDGNPETTTDLGINAIWLMPIFPSPSYHGYDVTDYLTVNSQYGTMDDFSNFIDEAHKRGIHVIIDFVINHTSDKHPWFIAAQDAASSYHNYYLWSEKAPGYLGPWNEQVWHRAQNGLYYYGVFTSSMPDLNYGNPAVTAEIESIAKFWLTEMKVDGFRVDGARHLIEEGETQVNTPETLSWFDNFRTLYKEWKPSAMSVGEVWDSSYITTKYLRSQSFDMVFDFDLASAWVTTVGMGDANSLSGSIQSEVDLYSGKGMGTFLANHDMNRVMSQLGGDEKKAGHAATALLTSPGTPFLYYGEEIGMVGEKPDEQIRTPMQWSAGSEAGFTAGMAWEMPNYSYKTVNVVSQTGDKDSLLSLYRNLIQLRMRHPALLEGKYIPLQTSDPGLYAALRLQGADRLLTVINLSGKTISAPIFTMSEDIPLAGNYELILLVGSGSFDSQVTVLSEGNSKNFQFAQSIGPDQNLVFQFTAK